MRFKQLKSQIIQVLLKEPEPELGALPPAKAARALLGLLASSQPLLKWRAVTALGTVAARLATPDMEPGREMLRRITWGMNDESGTAGFGLAEGMAAILAAHAGLRAEFLNILVSYLRPGYFSLLHPAMQQGVIWAQGRVAMADARALIERGAANLLLPLLNSPDPQARGLAAWALGHTGDGAALEALKGLSNDPNQITLFNTRDLLEVTVGELASDAMALLTNDRK